MTMQGFMNIAIWDMMGYCPNNMIVWSDLISNEQSAYEESWNLGPGALWAVFGDGAMDGDYAYNMIPNTSTGGVPYNYLTKDWE